MPLKKPKSKNGWFPGRNWKPSDSRAREIVYLYQALKKTPQEIGKHFGYKSLSNIGYVLRKEGVELRPGDFNFKDRSRGAREELDFYWHRFHSMVRHADKLQVPLGAEFDPSSVFGFVEFCRCIGRIPPNMNNPSVGRKNHIKGYVAGNFAWQEWEENKAQGAKFDSIAELSLEELLDL